MIFFLFSSFCLFVGHFEIPFKSSWTKKKLIVFIEHRLRLMSSFIHHVQSSSFLLWGKGGNERKPRIRNNYCTSLSIFGFSSSFSYSISIYVSITSVNNSISMRFKSRSFIHPCIILQNEKLKVVGHYLFLFLSLVSFYSFY